MSEIDARGVADARLWLCLDLEALAPDALLLRAHALLATLSLARKRTERVALWLRNASRISGRAALSLARSLRSIADEHRALLVIGERADLALLARADGLHCTHAAPTTRELRWLTVTRDRADLALSAPVHDAFEARAQAPWCAALLASPFGVVREKNAPLGIAGLHAIARAAPARALIALGGIDDGPAVRAALAAGARGVAVRRAGLVRDFAPTLLAIADAVRALDA